MACMSGGEVARGRLSKRLLPLINQAAAGYYASRDGELETWRAGEVETWRGLRGGPKIMEQTVMNQC